MMSHRFGQLLYLSSLSIATVALGADAPSVRDIHQAKPGLYLFEPLHSRIVWSLSHHGFSTYLGLLPDVRGTLRLDPKQLESSTLDVSVELGAVATTNVAFDERLKSEPILHTDRYPVATFRSTRIGALSGSALTVAGTMTFLGVSKPETLSVEFNKGGYLPGGQEYALGFNGRLTFKRSDFGMTAMLPSIGDEVTLQIEAELQPSPSSGTQ